MTEGRPPTEEELREAAERLMDKATRATYDLAHGGAGDEGQVACDLLSNDLEPFVLSALGAAREADRMGAFMQTMPSYKAELDRLREENEGLRGETRRLTGELDAANREAAFGAWGGYGGTEGENDRRGRE
ncbi:MAG: hypothetical protein M3R38_21460 [Actinomycetota bacterium]|nr:hypothetical protein [Actinomycetota bacterium]